MNRVEVKTHCAFCHGRCGVLVHVENGTVVRVKGNRESPHGQGYTCVKGRAAIEHLYHPDRLNYPLKMVGEKGESKWERISWDQALDEIAEQLKKIKDKYGPEALLNCEGTFRTGVEWVRAAFANLFGSPNYIAPGTVCYCNDYAIYLAIGVWFSYAWIEDPKCLVVWGANPAAAAPDLLVRIRQSKKTGMKVIVIDPRFTETAKEADIWLQLRPATDAALALGWLNVIIKEELYDREFVEKWTVGFDQLKERAYEYPPEKVAEITRVPKEQILESARMFATNWPGIIPYLGVTQDQIGRTSTPLIHALISLNAIMGTLDVPGGIPFGRSDDVEKIVWQSDLECSEKMLPAQRKKQLGTDRFKLQSWPGWELISEPYKKVYDHLPPVNPLIFASPMYVWDAILSEKPYPIKAAIVQANNPLLVFNNTKRVYRALKKLDLLIVMDYWLTPTAEIADYVLPAAGWLERDDVYFGGAGETGKFMLPSPKAIQPLYERRDDYLLWRDLAIRLGMEKDFPWEETREKLYDYKLKPIGISYKELVEKGDYIPPLEYRKYKKYEETGFATPSGKVELYSSIFEKLGYDPLPFYEEPGESPIRTPEIAKEYPLILSTSVRFVEMYHSEHRQIRSLRKLHPDPLVEIHEGTARELGIEEGDWVFIETRIGRIRQRAKLTRNVATDVVMVEHGWWFPEEPGEEPFLHGIWQSNPNVLTPDDRLEDCDQACGGWPMRGILCKIYKAKKYI